MGAVGDLQVSQWINLGKEGKGVLVGFEIVRTVACALFFLSMCGKGCGLAIWCYRFAAASHVHSKCISFTPRFFLRVPWPHACVFLGFLFFCVLVLSCRFLRSLLFGWLGTYYQIVFKHPDISLLL
jgi:hypothetical protein